MDKRGCPFCGATPHSGPEKVRGCQLHGDPIQDFSVWCPRGHAKITAHDEASAWLTWNLRTVKDTPSHG